MLVLNVMDKDQHVALHNAAFAGNVELCSFILSMRYYYSNCLFSTHTMFSKADVHAQDKTGRTPVFYAAASGCTSVIMTVSPT